MIDIEFNGESDKILVIEVVNVFGGELGIKFKELLFLIDEVDILFEEEGLFWLVVIVLVFELRRLIVLICNGVYFI